MSDTATPALHRESDTLYRQIAEIWREKIVTGEYKPGDALPSERDISESLGVSRIPVREAMKSLEYLGIVKQVRGKGVFVQKTDPGEVLAKIGRSSRRRMPRPSPNSSTSGFFSKGTRRNSPRKTGPTRILRRFRRHSTC